MRKGCVVDIPYSGNDKLQAMVGIYGDNGIEYIKDGFAPRRWDSAADAMDYAKKNGIDIVCRMMHA